MDILSILIWFIKGWELKELFGFMRNLHRNPELSCERELG